MVGKDFGCRLVQTFFAARTFCVKWWCNTQSSAVWAMDLVWANEFELWLHSFINLLSACVILGKLLKIPVPVSSVRWDNNNAHLKMLF